MPPKDVFPDGIRTSGQIPPIYEKLQSYEAFPKEISGPTVWIKDEYMNNPEKWVHRFTEEEVEELGATSDKFIKEGIPLTGVTQVRPMVLYNLVL